MEQIKGKQIHELRTIFIKETKFLSCEKDIELLFLPFDEFSIKDKNIISVGFCKEEMFKEFIIVCIRNKSFEGIKKIMLHELAHFKRRNCSFKDYEPKSQEEVHDEEFKIIMNELYKKYEVENGKS